MKKRLIFSSLLLKGFSSVIIQTLLIRELLIVFHGNELTFSIILSIWLIAGAAGSVIVGNLFKNPPGALRAYCLFQALLSMWVPIAVILIRTSKIYLGVSFAEVFEISHILIITCLALIVLAFSDGALFNLGFRLISALPNQQGSPVARIYLLESIGVIIGGAAFTFVLLTVFDSFQIAFIVAIFNLLCSSLLLGYDTNKRLKLVSWLVFFNFIGFYFQSGELHEWTVKKQWQKKNIIAYENSVYGNIAVSREADQYTVFYDGLTALSIPAPETYFTEDFIHLPLLAKPYAKRVLFVGNAVGGLLREAQKYPLQKIAYVELDPVFIQVIGSLHEPTADAELQDPRVQIELTDARNYIKNTDERFDCIFVNTGLPLSLALNRYYTQEFFKEVEDILAPGGIAVFKTWGSLAYLSDELKKINASLLKTLAGVFKYTDVIPGDGFNIFIASQQKPDLDPGLLASNWKALGLKTYLINPAYLELRLQRPYAEWFYAGIKDDIKTAPINQDLKPTGLYEGLSLYYSQFSKKIPRIFSGFEKVRPIHPALILIFFFTAWRQFCRRMDMRTASLNFTVLSTGFFSMSVQITVLLLFQSLLGYLFQWLAILTTSFMAGASMGAYYANRKIRSLSDFKALGLLEVMLPLTALVFIFITVSLADNMLFSRFAMKWSFSLVSICAGLLVGLEIPVAYHLREKVEASSGMETHKIAGSLYCRDLIGACLGALITPLVLIPSCGITSVLLILLLLKAGNGWNISRLTLPDR